MKFSIFFSAEIEPDFVSRAIMKRYNKPYSHVGVLVSLSVEDQLFLDLAKLPHPGEWIFHATGKGFHAELKDSYLAKGKTFVKLVPVRPLDEIFALGFLAGNIGKEYSSSQYLGFFSSSLAKLVANGKEKLICSEAVFDFLTQICGMENKVNQAPDMIAPPHIEEILS